MPAPKDKELLSVRAAVRSLYDYAKDNPTDTALDGVTRAVKFRVRTDESLKRELNRHFDAADKFRRSIASELESMFDRHPAKFFKMVAATASEPYEGKSSYGGWIDTKFVTQNENKALPSTIARSVASQMATNAKSFTTRRGNVTEEMKSTIATNQKLWDEKVPEYAKEFGIKDVPPAPPKINEDRPTDDEIEKYNEWVALARMWCNLIISQKHKISRREFPFPTRLKHFPSFPCSQKFKDRADLGEALASLREATGRINKKSIPRFAKLTDEEWAAVLDRFPAPSEDGEGPRDKVRLITGRRLHAILRDKPKIGREELAREIVAGLFRSADKLTNHLSRNTTKDRMAVAKLLNCYNTAAIFALEPLRLRSDYAKLFNEDTPRRNAYGEARGALHDASDTSEAIEIAGFSLGGDGKSVQYGGCLAMRNLGTGDEWAFLWDAEAQCGMQLLSKEAENTRRTITEWTAFATQGGSKKKAFASEKGVRRSSLWVKKQPLALPLQMGKRQGREYLWHSRLGLKDKDGWTLANARVIRICPSGRKDLADFYVVIALQRDLPHMAEPKLSKIIGVDRGEAIPAAYAILDAKGRVLERKALCEEFREQQLKFAKEKSELQSRYGGYSRWLKAKERNRAKGLVGQVTRELLSLAAGHKAPLVFERLNSALSTRGASGQPMSIMQYENVLSAVEQRMAEAACYKVPNNKDYRAKRRGFIWFVNPMHTSATCSKCGLVHSRRFYERLCSSLSQDKAGKWVVELDGKKVPLGKTYEYWNPSKRTLEQVDTAKHLALIIGDKPLEKVSKSARERIGAVVRGTLDYRPRRKERADRSTFICQRCGHKDDADLQAAVNIARKSLFIAESPKADKSDTLKVSETIEMKWQAWCESKCKSWS